MRDKPSTIVSRLSLLSKVRNSAFGAKSPRRGVKVNHIGSLTWDQLLQAIPCIMLSAHPLVPRSYLYIKPPVGTIYNTLA